jgi:hypothetical protein
VWTENLAALVGRAGLQHRSAEPRRLEWPDGVTRQFAERIVDAKAARLSVSEDSLIAFCWWLREYCRARLSAGGVPWTTSIRV